MADDPRIPQEFGASFQKFMEQMARQAPAEEPFFRRRLREHFKTDPSTLTIVSESFGEMEHANVHLAIEAFANGPGRHSEVLGITSDAAKFGGVGFADLVAAARTSSEPKATEGPVSYQNIRLDGGRVLRCLQLGVVLVSEGESRIAILLARDMRGRFAVEALAVDHTPAEAFFAFLRDTIRKRSVYRGHVISLSADQRQGPSARFHHLPAIGRDQIILPAGLLERIERQSIGFAIHADRLRAAGRHLKRGLLLHGAPGTGKTLTAMYLAARMPERTVLIITGRGMGLLESACAMARTLQPSTVILEDVDLIAQERTSSDAGCSPLLFELLNQMDGLADDADVLFVLTTNRPDLLEPALAARPGRIDLAIEVPVPDAECRRRLFELYGQGLNVVAPLDRYIAKTEGASAAFIRELLRRSALFAAEEGTDIIVKEQHFDAALHEMVMEGGDLTRSLLGGPRRSIDRTEQP